MVSSVLDPTAVSTNEPLIAVVYTRFKTSAYVV